jgi:hypothetical protein
VSKKQRSPEGIAKQRAYTKDWQQRNKTRRARQQRERGAELRLQCLQEYGGTPPRCSCCGTAELRHLALVYLGMSEDQQEMAARTTNTSVAMYRRLAAQGFPAGYGVQCWNCLMARSIDGVCPHQQRSPQQNYTYKERADHRSASHGWLGLRPAHQRVAERH